MTKARSDARGQHHVPEMLQRAFATRGSGKFPQLHVFDKHNDRSFRTSPGNILHQRDFNTFESDGVTYCLEGGMGRIEDQAAPVLRKIIEDRSLAGLTAEERAAVIVFTALQKVRGVSVRTDMANLTEAIRERLRANGDDPDLVPQLQGGDDPEQIKLSALMLVGKNLKEFAHSYTNKVMLLFAAAPDTTFLLGDTPVVLANHNDTFPYGNLGLEVPGIEIYMPIAPDLAIAFWCPSLVEMMEGSLAGCRASAAKTSAVALLGLGPDAEQLRALQRQLRERIPRIEADLAAVREERPLPSSPENMDYLNSLQVGHAERYVLSADGNFSLVRRMIADNAKHRRGHRVELA